MKNALRNNKTHIKLTGKTFISFILTFFLCSVLICISIINRVGIEKFKMEQLIMEKSTKANDVLSRLLYKTQTLSTLVIQNYGDIENFEQIAATIIDDPSILNVLIAPEGKVTNVFPLEGNEAVIGLDYFGDGAGNKEAIMAKETGQLVFGGPFDAVQGGQVLVGRLPVFITDEDGVKRFWGLVSVTLKYPQALDGAGLNDLQVQGYAYEIWRINPDNGERQIISQSGYKYNKYTNYIEKNISIQNADWCFRILPVRVWYQYPETWLLVFLSLCISILVAFVVQNNNELRILKSSYEKLSQIDTLTGIFNRRHFIEYSLIQVERTIRTNSGAFIIIFDIDFFKKINDKYGHMGGDDVLRGIVLRVNEIIRPYDIFARYGGEEFIILATDIKKSEVINLAERIRINIEKKPIKCGDIHITITASFGISSIPSINKFDESIDYADKALYNAKHQGRNKVVFYEYDENH